MNWDYICERLAERSTWRGIVGLITAAIGISLHPDQIEAIIIVGLAVGGAIGTFLPDRSKSQSQKDKIPPGTP